VINLYDANNVFRRAMEDRMPRVGNQPRSAFLDALHSKGVHVYVWDGYNHNARRRAHFEGYKIRPPVAENIYAHLDLLKELLFFTPAIQVEVPEWEADDVIGTLARHYAAQGHEVRVHSNDLDYYQLLSYDRIHVHGVTNPHGIDADYIPLYKSLVGDKSDKIDGIPGFGPKAFIALEPYWGQLIQCFNEGTSLDQIPFKPAAAAWVAENDKLLRAYWNIVHLWPVDLGLIEAHTHVGVANPAAGEALLRKYLL
jgi:5'-3' exonuclease